MAASDAGDAGDAADVHSETQHERAHREGEAQARARLAAELETVPVWGSAAFRAWIERHDVAMSVSLGALVHLLREAGAADERALAETLFVAVLRRTERQNTAWARRAVARIPLSWSTRESLREELKQELTLHLWQRLGCERGPAWELYFVRALDFAQRHVARTFLQRNGYWPSAAARPIRGPVLLLSALAAYSSEDEVPDGRTPLSQVAIAPDPFTVADLADLRDLVPQLPYRERVAVVMRFWLSTSEHDIARTLGVTTRTVRNLLARSYEQLRRAYEGG